MVMVIGHWLAKLKKNGLVMKLLLPFVKANKEEYSPKQIHPLCKCMIYFFGGGGD